MAPAPEPSRRLGLLYPTRGCGEDDFVDLARLLDPAIAVEFTYVPWGAEIGDLNDLDPAGRHAAVRELGAPEHLAASAKFDTEPGVVSWVCSSCSFTRGLAGAHEQARVLAERLGIPAGSTSLAFLAALDHLNIERVALASVYHDDTTASFAGFLAEAGVSAVHSVSADVPSDRALAAWSGHRITELTIAADHPDAEAVLVPETALHTTPLLEELEHRLGKPVLTATAVTVWNALRRLGTPPGHLRLGTLFRS
ncbi:decarboxylase [Amycolatopsis sp. NPDC051071]|uniref:maleate cis-trans isomerase family protein n=1 Tax=Amycolatopsis sp. NPDC051071 TaxID=3154637 RepID=UPI0034125B8C